jgi:hypothetical protein
MYNISLCSRVRTRKHVKWCDATCVPIALSLCLKQKQNHFWALKMLQKKTTTHRQKSHETYGSVSKTSKTFFIALEWWITGWATGLLPLASLKETLTCEKQSLVVACSSFTIYSSDAQNTFTDLKFISATSPQSTATYCVGDVFTARQTDGNRINTAQYCSQTNQSFFFFLSPFFCKIYCV